MRRKEGFTLIEVLIALSIFTVVVLTIYSGFYSGIFGYRNIEQTIEAYQAARQVLGRINSDLRNAFAYSEDEARFRGSENEMNFLTLVDTFSEGGIIQEYAFVSYKLDEMRLLRLYRKNKDALNEAQEIEPEEMALNIEKISFDYGYLGADGQTVEWKGSWGESEKEVKALPAAVRVKLRMKDKISYEFERTVFLPLA